MEKLIQFGFKKNNQVINGFMPHFIRGTHDILFLVGSGFTCKKITHISVAFRNTKFRVYGILVNGAPAWAPFDWVVHWPDLKLVDLKDDGTVMVARYAENGNELEWHPYEFLGALQKMVRETVIQVSGCLGVDPNLVMGNGSGREFTDARMICYHRIMTTVSVSPQRLARAFNKSSHNTVTNALNCFDVLSRTNREFQAKIQKCQSAWK